MQIKHLLHKHGGRITEVRKIAHATERGQPSFWFYEGTVEWDDGSKSDHVEIAPWAVCFDHGNAEAAQEFDRLSDALSDYLREQGAWNGRMWKPKAKFGHREIS